MPTPDYSDALDYSRRLLERVIDWYKNADSKAQIILTINGAFLTFLTSSIFKDPGTLTTITQRFSATTWLWLLLMCVCLVGSIVSALLCLWSRVFFFSKRDEVLVQAKERIKDGEKYPAELMLFFETISWLDHDKFQAELLGIDREFEIRALGSQSYLLARRVHIKHRLINLGFVLSGGSLIFFLASGISYLASFK